MTAKSCSCGGGGGEVLIFSCSGAADVGEIADRTARSMQREGTGSMFCLAGVGAGLESFMEKARGAARVLAIDGCPQDCALKCLHKTGRLDIRHLRLTDHGFEKGASATDDQGVAQACLAAAKVLG